MSTFPIPQISRARFLEHPRVQHLREQCLAIGDGCAQLLFVPDPQRQERIINYLESLRQTLLKEQVVSNQHAELLEGQRTHPGWHDPLIVVEYVAGQCVLLLEPPLLTAPQAHRLAQEFSLAKVETVALSTGESLGHAYLLDRRQIPPPLFRLSLLIDWLLLINPMLSRDEHDPPCQLLL